MHLFQLKTLYEERVGNKMKRLETDERSETESNHEVMKKLVDDESWETSGNEEVDDYKEEGKERKRERGIKKF